MRYMFLIHSASQQGPTPELMTAMHEMARQEVAAGRMIQDAGLAPPAMGKAVRLKGGKLMVTDGPFAETKEVFGGFAIFELPDMAAAVESAEKFMDLHRLHMPGWDGVCEIREVMGSQVEMIKAGG